MSFLSVLCMTLISEDGDHRLLLAAKEGDRDAFGKLFEKYSKRLFRVARRMCRSDDEAWDITQDAFIKAMKAMDRYNTDYKFFTWMYRIVTNTALNHIRSGKRRGEVEFDEEYIMESELSVDDEMMEKVIAGELKDSVEKAVEILSPGLKSVFILCIDQQMSYAETAKVLEIPMGTVMSRLSRARQAIARYLKENLNMENINGMS